MQGFNVLSYIDNRDLCEPPLTKSCSQNMKPKDTKTTHTSVEKQNECGYFTFIRAAI